MGFVSSILTILYTILFAGLTVGLTLMFSFTNSPDTASSMVVLTGHRTRDWSAPNSYSMHSASEDHHTRLYSCMMQAGITRGTFRSTLGEFRQDAKAYYNCGLESDMGWPRDYGFLRCLQNHFNATYHQGNVFLKCLDLSEGVMVESIQSRNSGLFLGSYNFVALQMASLAVITAFLIFTAGGAWNDDNEITITMSGHIGGAWRPLSTFNVNYALVWSFFMLASSLYYTFPMNNTWSDIPAVDDRNAFPTTPWGGYFCSMVFLAMFGFFFSYFLEWFSSTTSFWGSETGVDGDNVPEVTGGLGFVKRLPNEYEQNYDDPNFLQDPTSATSSVKSSSFMPEFGPSSQRMSVRPNNAYTRGREYDESLVSSEGGGSGYAPSSEGRSSYFGPSTEEQSSYIGPKRSSTFAPPGQAATVPSQRNYDSAGGAIPPRARTVTFPGRASSFTGKKFYKQLPNRHLGIRADTNENLRFDDTIYNSNIMLPFINKAFACTWVFADSLLFVGMLNTQNSLLTENVVTVCYYIFLCRAFQLAATFFMDRVVFEPETEHELTEAAEFEKTAMSHKTHQPNIVAACCQLCSFWCYAVVLLHFLNSFYLAYSLNMLSIGNQTYASQLTFVIIMTIMELVKHTLVFYSVLIGIAPGQYAMVSKIIFLVDCIARSVFILTTSMVVTRHLGDLNLVLYNNLKSA